jgi:hypothetical protein
MLRFKIGLCPIHPYHPSTMKPRKIRILTCALLGLGGPLIATTTRAQEATAPASVTADEKTAISSYTKAMKEGETLAKENPSKAENPAEAMALMGKMEKIIDSIKPDGLPADLGKAFGAFRTTVKKLIAHIASLPIPKELLTDQAKLQAWVGEQVADNPNFLQEFQEKMGKFQEGVATLSKQGDVNKAALDAVHKKYGIEVDLDAGKEGAKKAKPAGEKAGAEAEKEPELKKEAKPE